MESNIRLNIIHANGNSIEVMINIYEYNQIMKILLSSPDDVQKQISLTKKLAQKNLHNDSLSSNDGNEVKKAP